MEGSATDMRLGALGSANPVWPALSSTIERARDLAASGYDRLARVEHRGWFLQVTIGLALAGFVVHLGLVFAARQLGASAPLLATVNTNFLAALYTPFSFVLVYEVLLLILAIPKSTTAALGKQYEVVSLIVIRNVFKDIAEFESVTDLGAQLPEFLAVLLDLGGGLLMFLLVVVFVHVDSKRSKRPRLDPSTIESFVRRKKVMALLLSVVMFALALVSFTTWCIDVVSVSHHGAAPSVDIKKIFYVELFTVMIFADAVLLLLSLRLSTHYGLVFRNAAFVGSTILLRFALVAGKPYDVALSLVAVACGILVLLIYNYYLRVEGSAEVGEASA